MTRELRDEEEYMGFTLCFHIREHERSNAPCPTCRADIVRLVDGVAAQGAGEAVAELAKQFCTRLHPRDEIVLADRALHGHIVRACNACTEDARAYLAIAPAQNAGGAGKPDCYVVLDADGHASGTAPHVTLNGALADVAAERRERPHGNAPQLLYCYFEPRPAHPAPAGEPWPEVRPEDIGRFVESCGASADEIMEDGRWQARILAVLEAVALRKGGGK